MKSILGKKNSLPWPDRYAKKHRTQEEENTFTFWVKKKLIFKIFFSTLIQNFLKKTNENHLLSLLPLIRKNRVIQSYYEIKNNTASRLNEHAMYTGCCIDQHLTQTEDILTNRNHFRMHLLLFFYRIDTDVEIKSALFLLIEWSYSNKNNALFNCVSRSIDKLATNSLN